MLLGAIDIGTNSIHLLVVELDPSVGTSRTVLKAREMVRLGGGEALARGHLGKKAIARGVDAIARFVRQAREAGAEAIRAVATATVREAANRDEFLDAVRAAAGIEVEVLADREEARLIHLGVSRGFPLYDRIGCIIDIGGGSTEFIVGDGHRPYLLESVKIGSLRLYDEHLRADERSAVAYRDLKRRIRAALDPVTTRIRDFAPEVVIGTSGTIMGLAALDAAARGLRVERTHGYELRLDRLRKLQRQMLRMTPAERRRMPGMNPRRSDIIVAGNEIVITALELIGARSLIVCERALREGLVVDFMQRNGRIAATVGDERARRFEAIRALARDFGGDGAHENHVAALALSLFDQLNAVAPLQHRLEPADRDALFAAAILHDVGRIVNASAHHKHGAYIVRNAALDGWRPEQRELIALLVRYHRKAMPKPVHLEYASLDAAMRRRVDVLASLLRIANGLDARRLGLVAEVKLAAPPGGLTGAFRITACAEQDIDPEIDAARARADLFARAFGAAPAIVADVRSAAAEPDGSYGETVDGAIDGPRPAEAEPAAAGSPGGTAHGGGGGMGG